MTIPIWTFNNNMKIGGTISAGSLITVSTSNPDALTLATSVAATGGANQSGPILTLQSNYWNGSASTADQWTLQNVVGTGTNPTSTLVFAHTGTSNANVGVAINPLYTNRIDTLSSGVGAAPYILMPTNGQFSINGLDTGSIVFLEGVGGFDGGNNQIEVNLYRTGPGPHGVWFQDNADTMAFFWNNDTGNLTLQSRTAIADTLTQVQVIGGTTTYFGTITQGGSNMLAGMNVSVTGFANGGNNLVVTVLTSNGTQFTVTTTTQVNETHAGTATINYSQPAISTRGSWWNGTAAVQDITTIQNLIGTGTAPTSTLIISNTGAFAWGGVNVTGALTSNTLTLNSATPTVFGTQVGLGTTVGFGNGTAGTTVTTTTLGTGSGPATPQTVVKYLQVNIGTSTYWMPLVQ